MLKKKLFMVLFLLIVLVLPIQAQTPTNKIYLPVIVKMKITDNTDNNWRIIQPLESSNRVLNPSAETTGNFSAIATATTTRSTTYQKYGLYSYRVQPAASGDGLQLTTSTLANEHHYVTFRVRGDFTSLSILLNSNSVPARKIEKIDQNWDLYGASFDAAKASGATAVQITDTASGDFYVDGVQVEPQTQWTTYIDGTQGGCEWLGVPHESVSQRSGNSWAGGVSEDFWEEYNFQIRTISGAGATSRNLGIDSFALLPGGELNSDKPESREYNIVGKFIADSEENLLQSIQELQSAFNKNDLQLTRIRFNGAKVQKEIGVRYQSGLEIELAAFYGCIEIVEDEQYQIHTLYTMPATIQVIAPNPYWLEVGESATNLDTNDSATFRTVAGRLRSTGQWDNLGPPNAAGTYSNVWTIAEDNTYIYFGGNFTNFDNIANADYIVRWHKVNEIWSALGSGFVADVIALTIGPDGTLYAGGKFNIISGDTYDYIAAWNGSAWSALGSGTDDFVWALTIGPDGTLYAGGEFLNAGGGAAAYVAAWDGSAWSALGSGTDDTVFELETNIDGTLYAGGEFLNAGGSSAAYVAAWNPDTSTWSTLGSGMDDTVSGFAIKKDGTLYAAGQFLNAGGNPAAYIASWNGTSWSALSSGMDADVFKIRIGPDDVLYAIGDFTEAGGIEITDKISKWNGSTWAHLDLNFPGIPNGFGILASKKTDPIINQKYDIFVGYNTTGTGTYGGLVTVDNEGTVPAFPTIVYARSGGTTAVLETLRNERTAKELLFDYSILDGESLVITLQSTQKNIQSSMFGQRLDAVLANSDFGTWSLLPGDNDITSYINESGTPTLEHYMLWRDAYDGYN